MSLQRVVREVIAAAPAVGVEGCSELSAGDGDASMAVFAPEGEMANTSLPDLGLKLTISEPARERGFRQIHMIISTTFQIQIWKSLLQKNYKGKNGEGAGVELVAAASRGGRGGGARAMSLPVELGPSRQQWSLGSATNRAAAIANQNSTNVVVVHQELGPSLV
ncbi:hypothetical protein E2562_015396 [Oryza meyeriana var. granulata]|uniref:Uncharacterized protein n=1 Tax=Oryza meyeriana var. granulata TaxID=110450 RepID=A0A6G1ELX9_9ORYZ|nr:hypothetical protein E2562_015396 [Oryza meyeriana var. granulata]